MNTNLGVVDSIDRALKDYIQSQIEKSILIVVVIAVVIAIISAVVATANEAKMKRKIDKILNTQNNYNEIIEKLENQSKDLSKDYIDKINNLERELELLKMKQDVYISLLNNKPKE